MNGRGVGYAVAQTPAAAQVGRRVARPRPLPARGRLDGDRQLRRRPSPRSPRTDRSDLAVAWRLTAPTALGARARYQTDDARRRVRRAS